MKQICFFVKGGLSHKAKLEGKEAREHSNLECNLLCKRKSENSSSSYLITDLRLNASSLSKELSLCFFPFTSQQPESTADGKSQQSNMILSISWHGRRRYWQIECCKKSCSKRSNGHMITKNRVEENVDIPMKTELAECISPSNVKDLKTIGSYVPPTAPKMELSSTPSAPA